MKPIVVGTVVVICSCIVSTALAEAVIRMFYPHTRDYVLPNGIITMDALLGWRLAPGASGRHVSRHFDVTYSVNNQGFRDTSRREEKQPGVRRMLLFGDSQVFGWGVAEHDRFSNILAAGSPGLEVWNVAVPGYGLDQEFISYQKNLANVPADDVLFFLSVYTARRVRTNYAYSKYKPQFTIADHELQLSFTPGERASVMSTVYRTVGGLYLPYFVQFSLQTLSARRLLTAGCGDCFGSVETHILMEASRIAEARRQKMTVIVQTPPHGASAVLHECATLRLHCLPIELDDNAVGIRFGQRDPHFTPRAHALVAAQIRSQLPL